MHCAAPVAGFSFPQNCFNFFPDTRREIFHRDGFIVVFKTTRWETISSVSHGLGAYQPR